jgi:membrane protease YdiL (CAAX protease family)
VSPPVDPDPDTELDSDTDARRVTFTGGWPTVVAFLLLATFFPGLGIAVAARTVGIETLRGSVYGSLYTAATLVVFALLALLLLRREGVSASEIGLDADRLRVAVLSVAGMWIAVNAAAVGVLSLFGDPTVGVPRADGSRAAWLVEVVVQAFFVGVVEEFVYRGYLQSRVVAAVGGSASRWRKAIAIGLAAALFAVMHLPQRLLVGEMAIQQAAANVPILLAAGVALGVVYELTRNVALVGLLHGTVLNRAPLFVVSFEGTDAASGTLTLVVLVAVLSLVWLYRRWARANRRADFRAFSLATASERTVQAGGE